MATLPEQITAAGRDQFLAQLEFFGSLASAAIDNTRQLADAQIGAGRATFNRSAQAMRQLMEVRDPRDFAGAGFSAAGVDRWIEYSREIFTLMTGMAVPQRGAPPAPASVPALAAPPQPADAGRQAGREEWPASQADAGQPLETGTTQPEEREAPRASQADAGGPPATGTTQQPSARQQPAQADASGADIPSAAQLQKIVDEPSFGLPPAEGALTPVADAVAKTVGKKPALKK